MTKRAAPDVIDLTESPPEAGPSAATPQTPYDRAVAKCKESGARLAPAQHSMLQRLPEESLHLIACGLATLSEVEAAAAQDLADSWEPTPEEEREEMEGLNAYVTKMRLAPPPPPQACATTFLQRRRLPSGESIPSVRWCVASGPGTLRCGNRLC